MIPAHGAGGLIAPLAGEGYRLREAGPSPEFHTRRLCGWSGLPGPMQEVRSLERLLAVEWERGYR